jgi:hypothetical protein
MLNFGATALSTWRNGMEDVTLCRARDADAVLAQSLIRSVLWITEIPHELPYSAISKVVPLVLAFR